MDEMLDSLMPSWEKIAQRYDIVLLDNCAIEGHSKGKTFLEYLFDDDDKEGSLRGLQSYENRHGVVSLVTDAYDNICTIPEVSEELDRLLVHFRRNFNHLIRAPIEVKESFPDFGERVRTLRHIIQDFREIKKLSERNKIDDPEYGRFANLYHAFSAAADRDFGVTDNRLSARGIYENLKGRKAAIITDDGDQLYIMKAAFPALLGIASDKVLEKLKKNYTQVYMPGKKNNLRYDLAYSTTFLHLPRVPESAAHHAPELKEAMDRISS